MKTKTAESLKDCFQTTDNLQNIDIRVNTKINKEHQGSLMESISSSIQLIKMYITKEKVTVKI